MDKNYKKMVEEEEKRINQLEKIINGVYASKVKVVDGAVNVQLSPSEIKELVAAESQLMEMKRRHIGLPKELQ